MSEKTFAAIWDMDGTLVDTAELHFQSWVRLCAEVGRSFTREQFAHTFGRRNPDIVRILFGDEVPQDQAADLAERKEEYYRELARGGVHLLPGARTLLEALRRHRFRQAIGSSAPRANLELILELTETSRFFQAIVSMEDTTRGKPDPQVFLIAAERLGMTPDRCVVFEDAPAGVEGARAGGMKCIAARLGSQHTSERLRQAGAQIVVESLVQVTPDTVQGLLEEVEA